MKRLLKTGASINIDNLYKILAAISVYMEQGYKISDLNQTPYSDEQLLLLLRGYKKGYDIKWYSDTDFDTEQMKELYVALVQYHERGFKYDLSRISKKEYSVAQMKEIRFGLQEPSVEKFVSYYESAEFSAEQMKQARIGFQHLGEDAIDFVNLNIDAKTMREIRIEKENQSNTNNFPNNFHDLAFRDTAIVYVDGKFYENESHALCLDDYREEQNISSTHSDFYRPTKEEMEKYLEEDQVMFFAHKVEDPYSTKKRDYAKNFNAIYIMEDSTLLKNITTQEAANITKQKYPDYDVFLEQFKNEDYQRLAKLSKIKKMLKNSFMF